MAKLHPEAYVYARTNQGFSMAAMKEDEEELTRLTDNAAKLPEGEIVGGILGFPVADGSALYLVTSKSPLTLQHIPFFDGYAIDASHIRGLRLEDVTRRVAQDKHMKSMFAA